MSPEQSIMVKNKLGVVITNLNKLSEAHNELKHILEESIVFDDNILEEELFWDISQDIIEIQLEVNSNLKNLM